MKTIFYKESHHQDPNPDYRFENRGYNEWFTLDNVLYDPSVNCDRRTLTTVRQIGQSVTKKIHRISITNTQDIFSADEGIIRKIALSITD